MQLAYFSQRMFERLRMAMFRVALSFAMILTAFAGVFFQSGEALAETRTLKMYYTHSKESATITFKRNGRYVKSGLRKANRFLRDWRRKEPTRMDPALLDLVWEVYQRSGSRKPIHVISGYRSPRTNNMLRRRGRKVARNSQHTRGKALDFFLPDVSVTKLRALGLKAHRGGVGYYRGSFVHLDTGRVRHWPRMSKRQLARIFPRGKTIHVPSNGRPLRGFKVAKVNLKKGLNADGTRRRTKVRTSILARLFSGSGGDENEGDVSRTSRRGDTAPKKAVKKVPVRTELKPVVVAATRPEPKKAPSARKATGSDPFSTEQAKAQKALANRQQEDERKSQEAEAKAAEDAANKAAEEAQLASLVPNRVAVPRRRPVTGLALAPETRLAPDTATELALATPATITNVLRPAVEIPQPVEPAARSEDDIDKLKVRIKTALASRRNTSAVERATQMQASAKLAAAASKIAAPKTIRNRPAAVVAALRPEDLRPANVSLPIPRIAPTRSLRPVRQASLEPTPDFFSLDERVTKPSWREKSVVPAREAKVIVTPNPASVPIPSLNPVKDALPTTLAVATGATARMRPELRLGDLDGHSVKAWAVSTSTRVGPVAVLTAPNYKKGTSRVAPASVYSAGFAFARSPLRADRFNGRALTRVAFAHFGQRN